MKDCLLQKRSFEVWDEMQNRVGFNYIVWFDDNQRAPMGSTVTMELAVSDREAS